MGRTACTEPQCLYKGALYLYLYHRSDCRNTLIYAHTNSRSVLTCDISLVSLTLHAPVYSDFMELILLYILN
jgi:hypothetical protein